MTQAEAKTVAVGEIVTIATTETAIHSTYPRKGIVCGIRYGYEGVTTFGVWVDLRGFISGLPEEAEEAMLDLTPAQIASTGEKVRTIVGQPWMAHAKTVARA